MTQDDIVYADVKFTKSQAGKPGDTCSVAETIYSEVKIKGPSDSQSQVTSAAGSKVTSERVALVILSALLTAAVVALIYFSWDSIQTKESLHHMKDISRNLTERYDELQESLLRMTSMNKNLTESNAKLKETLDKASCPAGVNTTTPCPPCPENWEEHGDQCYLFQENATPWELARQQCQQEGGNLARIDSEDEQEFLTERVNEKMKAQGDTFWIGLTDAQTEGEWLWVDGSALNESLIFWYKQGQIVEPDDWKEENPEDGEDCARMGLESNEVIHANWFDRDCNFLHKSICEKAAVRGHLFCV
ncbi:uncharacterized protein LOC142890981 isoform X2 [Nelusetta ayraudi]|uniref:uncharacterized protein LOC142890981 isoform X2 n=1 Tax=Nelusetta ayraudi TaxID=303726 RepID=UPI003F6FDF0A